MSKFQVLLGGQDLAIGGTIINLECNNCGFVSCKLDLAADTDMTYMGIIGLTDTNVNRIIATYLTHEEINMLPTDFKAIVEKRMNTIFNTNSLVYYYFESCFDEKTAANNYGCKCPKCQSIFEISNTLSLVDYINSGGEVIFFE